MLALLDIKAILITALIFIPLETILPLRPGQKRLRAHWRNDSVYLLVNGLIVKLSLLALTAGMLAMTAAAIPHVIATVVQAQPVWLQVIEVLLIADTGFYFAHRCFHAVPALWKFHAVHHSIEEMDWLAAYRVHPLDQIATKAASYLPVFALGFSVEAILAFSLLYKWQSLVIHSNSRLNLGPLRLLLATPHFHHWHHANEPAAFDKNFAGQLPLLDLLFGTLFLPDRMPARYGADDPVPALYHQQLLYPLRQHAPRAPTPEVQDAHA
jgi:sterol desaturase/sphingolipid hydroxylase (fatty acid hydroxylase superfamily)